MKFHWDVVDSFEHKYGANAAFHAARDFMIEYLSFMESQLPRVGAEGLAVAKKFQQSLVGAAKIEIARVACWKYLEGRDASLDKSTRETSAIRAVICILNDGPVAGGDVGDLLDLFLTFANRVEDHSDRVESLLKRCFVRPAGG